MSLILFQNPYRMTADEIKLQEFVEEDGRCFDIITVGVLDFDEDEDQERMEKYYFDITAGYQKTMREM